MKPLKRLIPLLLLLLANTGKAVADNGNPFIVNYLPDAYHAHNRNFDVVSDDNGRVYVANFEGLLYYDQAEWHTIHAPGVFRITKLYKASDGRIWVGGYNLFGYLTPADNGELQLKAIFSKDSKGFLGEVTGITEVNGKIHVESSLGDVADVSIEESSMKDFVVTKSSDEVNYHNDIQLNQTLHLPNGSTLLATQGEGIILLDAEQKEVFHLTEQDGLCNNNVNALYPTALGHVWGATDNGIFLLNIESPYTRFNASDGLVGEVQSICHTPQGLYVGTLQGLYRQNGKAFEHIGEIRQACWQLLLHPGGTLYASTADGLFAVEGNKAERITSSHTLSMLRDDDGAIYTGEVDGIYYNKGDIRKQHNIIEKATLLMKGDDGTLWVRNIFGQVFHWYADSDKYTPIEAVGEEGDKETFNNTLFLQGNDIYLLSRTGLFQWNAAQKHIEAEKEQKLWSANNQYPKFVYADDAKRIWFTDNEGKDLRVYSNTQDMAPLNTALHPLYTMSVQAMEVKDNQVWVGGNFGLIQWQSDYREAASKKQSQLYIRKIVINRDSLVWGGFNGNDHQLPTLPFKELTFDSDIHRIACAFSTDIPTTVGQTEYRYRLNDADWSPWSTEAATTIENPQPGTYTLEIMAKDCYGHEVEAISLDFTIRYPIYLRWYSILAYVLLLAVAVYWIIKWRLRKLEQETIRLENIVSKRTEQIRSQKDEIEEKSKNLEKALTDLSNAQFQLIRQEKMATVGTLTKGLVDRILNPMNYINNFSHLSIGLVKDVNDNLEEEKENITPDILEDTQDVLDMLNANLQKIEEHGMNTTRILKAMEEILKDRKLHTSVTDLAAMCRKNLEVVQTYHASDIAACHIRLEGPTEEQQLEVSIDAEQVSKVIMSMLANSIHAVKKKYLQKKHEPVVRLSIRADEAANLVYITIYDNGIGMEESIRDKIYDPFFTTKPTSEAAGTGLYLSREIILNHQGNIQVKSQKDEYTEFTISIPNKK